MKRVLLVDPHELFRESFARALQSSPELEVEILQSSSFEEARTLIADLKTEGFAKGSAKGFDAALVDIELPDGDGTALVGEMKRATPSIPVLVLSSDLDPAHSGLARLTRQAGAEGLLSKMASLEEATAAVKRLTRG